MHAKTTFIPADLLHEAIVDSSDDAIISKDLHGIVMSWNKSAERIFGYTAPEMIGQSIAKLFPIDRLEEETHILDRLQRGERVDHFETQRQHKNGRLIDVSLTISPIRDARGTVVGASKIARNITEQKDAQRKLASALEELKRADRMKAEFLAPSRTSYAPRSMPFLAGCSSLRKGEARRTSVAPFRSSSVTCATSRN